jgi:phytoene dehydrogenase-like protein
MTAQPDIVVAGGGHNSLIAAAYLARAGYTCTVLDARSIPGGGAATEELMLPGYKIDSCSTGHTLIQGNPLIRLDELGLLSDYGLEYVDPDPVAVVAFPDGEHLTHWLDLERTCEEIERFSKRDEAAFRRLIAEYEDVRELFTQAQHTPVGFGPGLLELLAEHPRGNIWRRRLMLSSWDIIRHEFESPHVRAYLAWQAFQTLVPIDGTGSGALVYTIVGARQRRSWTVPLGGSGKLTEALVAYLEDHGATVICDRVVTRLIIEGDRCVGVETEDGEQFRAGRAVLSTIHVKHLIDMAPADLWDEDFRYGVDTYDLGMSAYASYYATDAPPVFDTAQGPRSAVSAGIVGWAEDVIAASRTMASGDVVEPVPWMLIATPTLVDPDRAPNGHHTVKLLGPQGWRLPNGESWDSARQRTARARLEWARRFVRNLEAEHVLAELVKTPLDLEASNRHMIRGAIHGGARTPAFTGAMRPAPGWASHRMPIAGLYQTGGTTHPGGSITGASGRGAAIAMLEDFGHSTADMLAAARADPVS